jgi:hypothetical protein
LAPVHGTPIFDEVSDSNKNPLWQSLDRRSAGDLEEHFKAKNTLLKQPFLITNPKREDRHRSGIAQCTQIRETISQIVEKHIYACDG